MPVQHLRRAGPSCCVPSGFHRRDRDALQRVGAECSRRDPRNFGGAIWPGDDEQETETGARMQALSVSGVRLLCR